jgi:hypothetical protein
MQKLSALFLGLLVGLAIDCVQTYAFHIGQANRLHGLTRSSLSMKFGDVEKAVDSVDRRSAVTDFLKFASFCLISGPSLPVHAKRARGGMDTNKDTVPETREEREARIKRDRAEYEERRKQAEVPQLFILHHLTMFYVFLATASVGVWSR